MDRTAILEQVSAGQLSADEAARLLSAPSAGEAAPAAPNPALAGRWLHVRVTDLDSGKAKVNVNLPMTWVDVGLRIGSQFHPQVAGVDLGSLLQQVQAGAQGRLVEVEDLEDRERVEIYVE